MTTPDPSNEPASQEVTRLQQRIADLEQQVAAHAAADERLNRAETELEIFQALLESAIDGISFATPDRVVRYANGAFGAMSGYGAECIGQMISDFIVPAERAAVQE